MRKPQIHKLGNLTRDDINFPEYLTPEIVHTTLFIHNAPTKEDITKRVEHSAKLIGDKAMTYVMALLILPMLMDNMTQSKDYKDFLASKKKTIN